MTGNRDSELNDDGDDFAKFLGEWGSHANGTKRAHAERLASMAPTDKRRKRAKPVRPHQYNVRVSNETQAMASELCVRHGWSQADLIAAAIAELHKRGTKQ